LALKVTFCCEFAGIAQKYGISYPEVRDIFIPDGRMGDSHTFVYPEHPYYDSHCLNKDIPALIAFAGEAYAPLMSAMNKINSDKKRGI
jgi:UDP-glucose 6-dehydrogenase